MAQWDLKMVLSLEGSQVSLLFGYGTAADSLGIVLRSVIQVLPTDWEMQIAAISFKMVPDTCLIWNNT